MLSRRSRVPWVPGVRDRGSRAPPQELLPGPPAVSAPSPTPRPPPLQRAVPAVHRSHPLSYRAVHVYISSLVQAVPLQLTGSTFQYNSSLIHEGCWAVQMPFHTICKAAVHPSTSLEPSTSTRSARQYMPVNLKNHPRPHHACVCQRVSGTILSPNHVSYRRIVSHVRHVT